jgi:hypothetical protein
MKRTLVFTLLLSSLAMMAQQNSERKGRPIIKASAENMAQVQSKQLTLALVLDEKQEKQVYNLELDRAKEMKASMEKRQEAKKEEEKPDPSDRMDHRLKMLDAQIAFQGQMQKILTEEQFKMWRQIKMQNHRKPMKEDHHRHMRDSRRK